MQPSFNNIPDITKNLIIINLLMFLTTICLGDIVTNYLAVYYVQNEHFYPFQLVTSFFMHDGVFHILFNMFALFMLGSEVERTLGPRKYLFLYLVAGFGANILNMVVDYVHVQYLLEGLNEEQIALATGQINSIRSDLFVPRINDIARIWLVPALGASGAVYGILFAFAVLYPNRMLYIIPFPFPLKGTSLVLALTIMEFALHVSNLQTGIGHMVHLSGGAIGIAASDKVLMLEHSTYSVISPEGCASILWRSTNFSQEAANTLKLTSEDCKKYNIVDSIIPELPGGAHRNSSEQADLVKKFIFNNIQDLKKLSLIELIDKRKNKYLNITSDI